MLLFTDDKPVNWYVYHQATPARFDDPTHP